MKIKDLIQVSIGIAIIGLGSLSLSNKINGGAIGLIVIGVYLITYVILAVRHEKRLESEISDMQSKYEVATNFLKATNEAYDELQTDLANQVKATDEVEEKVVYYEKALIDTNELNLDSDSLSNLRVVNETGIHKIYNLKVQLNRAEGTATFEAIPLIEVLPFAEESHPETSALVCPECGLEMTRTSSKIAYCDNPSCSRKQWRIDKLKEVE